MWPKKNTISDAQCLKPMATRVKQISQIKMSVGFSQRQWIELLMSILLDQSAIFCRLL
jgi:hypothetical protein